MRAIARELLAFVCLAPFGVFFGLVIGLAIRWAS